MLFPTRKNGKWPEKVAESTIWLCPRKHANKTEKAITLLFIACLHELQLEIRSAFFQASHFFNHRAGCR